VKTLSVGILQNTIYPYREPFFTGLADHPDMEITVLYCDEALDTDHFQFPTEFVAVKNMFGLHLQPTLRKAVEKFDVIVIMFNIRYVDMTKLLYDRKLRKNTALALWGHGFGKQRWMNSLRLRMMHRSDGMILYYQEQIERFVSPGIPSSKLFAAQNTINVANYGYDVAVERTNFLFVGRLQKRKNLENLLLAFSQLADQHVGVELDIVGSGEHREQLQRITEEAGISKRVNFHGRIDDHDQLKTLFSRAIAYVSPGAVGLGVLHAFAYGCPVITRREDPNHGPEFINLQPGENAILTENSAESLREAMESIISDDRLAIVLQEGAFNFYAKHRTMKNMVENMEAAIREIWKNKKHQQ
jgi:glycosyltransferase involved in cell wall biosynthesis